MTGVQTCALPICNDSGVVPSTLQVAMPPVLGFASVVDDPLGTPMIVYSPFPGLLSLPRTDTFQYSVDDGTGNIESATVTMTITAPPNLAAERPFFALAPIRRTIVCSPRVVSGRLTWPGVTSHAPG